MAASAFNTLISKLPDGAVLTFRVRQRPSFRIQFLPAVLTFIGMAFGMISLVAFYMDKDMLASSVFVGFAATSMLFAVGIQAGHTFHWGLRKTYRIPKAGVLRHEGQQINSIQALASILNVDEMTATRLLAQAAIQAVVDFDLRTAAQREQDLLLQVATERIDAELESSAHLLSQDR